MKKAKRNKTRSNNARFEEALDRTRRVVTKLFGEQYRLEVDSEGEAVFFVRPGGTPVSLSVEPYGSERCLLVARHIIGARVEDMTAAVQYVVERNDSLRLGSVVVRGDMVVFSHALFSGGITTDAVRSLIEVAAYQSCEYSELASRAGALRWADVAVLYDESVD
jgi:hypothetical protein